RLHLLGGEEEATLRERSGHADHHHRGAEDQQREEAVQQSLAQQRGGQGDRRLLGGTQRGVEDAAEAVELTSQQWWEGEGEHQHRRPRAEVRGARDLTLLAGLLELLGCRLLCLLAAGVL